ncbi:MAG: hypothetical protein WCH86_06465 [Kiritimatiellales bacterium]
MKKSNSPDPRTSRSGKRWRHILGLMGFTLGLSVLLALFALLVVGLPPELTRRITAQVREAGLPLQVDSIRLSTHRGWALSNFRIYSTSPDDLQPLLSAKELYVMLWPVDWKNPSKGGWHIKIYVKNLGVSLGRPWESVLPNDHPFRNVKKLEASLTAAPGRFAVENAKLSWGGINILAHGTALFSSEGEAHQDSAATDFRYRAAKVADALSRLKCERPPELSLIFNFNDARPEEMSLNAELSAKGISWNNRVYKNLSGTLGCRDNTWNLSALHLSQSDREQLVLRGAINLQNSNAQVSVENTLSAVDLFNLLPEDAQSAVAQTGVKPYGRFDFTASAGPAPYDQLAEKVAVQVQQAHIKRQDITLDPIAFHLERDGNSVTVKDLVTRANDGPLTGSLELDLGSKAWKARIQAQCDPSIAGGYDEDLRDFILRFKFPNEQLKADLAISQSNPDESVVISGTLSADRFTCGGVPIGHLETFMVYSNQFLDLTPVTATRDGVRFDGSVQVDFNRSLAFFNATNTFPPADVARALAPEEHIIVEEFLFNGPVLVVGSGQLDYGTWTNHDFRGTFSATNISMGKLQASAFYSDIQGRGAQLAFTNSSIDLYSGRAEGSAEFDIFLEDGSAPYHINARIGQIDLKQLLGQVGRSDYKNNRTRGQLAASLDLTADAKAGFWKSVRGAGQAKIENGLLADIPLFGGFSRLIQSAFAGFNLFSLTAFSADYELHDGAIWSDNAQLGGTLISARGRGNYSPEKGLNFTVAAEPLRQTGDQNKEWYRLQRLAAGATAPFLRLLEFKLEGPLEKPEWRFVNLPK